MYFSRSAALLFPSARRVIFLASIARPLDASCRLGDSAQGASKRRRIERTVVAAGFHEQVL